MTRRFMVAVAAISLTIVSGAVYRGTHADWPAPLRDRAQMLLAALPNDVGLWERVAAPALGDDALKMLNCRVHVNHNFRHRETGAVVTSTIMLASAGPLSVHAPEVCYASDNYEVVAPRQRVSLSRGAVTDEFWRVVLRPSAAGSHNVVVYYGWHTTEPSAASDSWVAPDKERYYFAGKRMLYKLQLACHTGGEDEDQGEDFLAQLLPLLDDHLLLGG